MTPSVCVVLMTLPAAAADLEPRTVAAFDHYVAVSAALARGRPGSSWRSMPWPTPSAGPRWPAWGAANWSSTLATNDRGRQGHDTRPVWLITGEAPRSSPGATVAQAVALLQDYDRHAEIYRPNVARSRTLSKDGDVFRVFLRFYMKKVITVVVNSEHEARFSWPAPVGRRAASTACVSPRWKTRTRRGARKPVGQDGGYLWRLNTYWRFLERDGGTYIQCESISLTARFRSAWAGWSDRSSPAFPASRSRSRSRRRARRWRGRSPRDEGW